MKKYLYIALAALGMMGCSDDTFEQDGEGVGYLRLELGKVDVELSSLTKAEVNPLPDKLVPEAAKFMVDVKMGGKSVNGFPKPYSDIIETGGIELKAGTYTVIAYHGEDEPIQAEPYFEGSSTVQINPGQATPAKIDAALANAMLLPAVSENLQKHYSDWTLTAKVGDASLTLADDENSKGYLFVQAERAVNAVFEGTNLLENKTTHEWTVISSAAKQTRYVIQCDPDLSVFSNIKISATATHTYAENVLTGTDVTLNIEDNGAPLELINGWSITLQYNGNLIRTYTIQPENDALMTVMKGWPYVPQGSTLSASIFLRTGETIFLPEAILETIPQPEFTTTVSGNTSYSVYLDSGAETANTKDGSSIFDINATASIAPEILDNPNYSNLLKVTYTTDSEQNSEELPYGTSTQFNSLPWQKHALSATVSFDSVRVTSSPLDCHVTGLPYRADPPTEIDWSGDPTEWNAEYVRFQLAGQNEISKSFYVPSDVNVSVYQDVHVRRATVATEYKLYLGDATLCTLSPSYMSSVDDKKTYDGVMTSSNPTIKCYNSYGNPDSFVEGTNAKVYEIAVSYR